MENKMVNLNYYQSLMILSELDKVQKDNVVYDRVVFDVFNYIVDKTIELFSNDNGLSSEKIRELKEYSISVNYYVYLSNIIGFDPLKHEGASKKIINSYEKENSEMFNDEFEEVSSRLKKQRLLK